MQGDLNVTGLERDTLKDQLEYALLPNGINQQEQFLQISSLHSICNEITSIIPDKKKPRFCLQMLTAISLTRT
jgi:hypothetical protein